MDLQLLIETQKRLVERRVVTVADHEQALELETSGDVNAALGALLRKLRQHQHECVGP